MAMYIVFVQTISSLILIGPDRLTTSKLTGCHCHRLSGLRIPHHPLAMPSPNDILIAYFQLLPTGYYAFRKAFLFLSKSLNFKNTKIKSIIATDNDHVHSQQASTSFDPLFKS